MIISSTSSIAIVLHLLWIFFVILSCYRTDIGQTHFQLLSFCFFYSKWEFCMKLQKQSCCYHQTIHFVWKTYTLHYIWPDADDWRRIEYQKIEQVSKENVKMNLPIWKNTNYFICSSNSANTTVSLDISVSIFWWITTISARKYLLAIAAMSFIAFRYFLPSMFTHCVIEALF